MTNIFFTSDTHFGHESILEYCKRPFKTVDEMNEELIKRWNEVVKPEDVVYHLGDFSFQGKQRTKRKVIMQQLNGTVILIKGNHDKGADTPIREIIMKHGGINWKLLHDAKETNARMNVLCGHVHELWKIKKIGQKLAVNVGVDVWEFRPVSIQEILNAIEKYKQGEN